MRSTSLLILLNLSVVFDAINYEILRKHLSKLGGGQCSVMLDLLLFRQSPEGRICGLLIFSMAPKIRGSIGFDPVPHVILHLHEAAG